MLIFSLTHSLISLKSNSDTNYLQWPFLKIILNFYQETHVSVIQNKSYQQRPEKNENYHRSPKKMKNNGEHKRQY